MNRLFLPFLNASGEPDPGLEVTTDPFEVLFDLDGLYECPKDGETRRGPLVGYAGRDEQDRQYVGDLYANYAEAEQWPWIYQAWTRRLKLDLDSLEIDVYAGMPMGGIFVAGDAASLMRRRRIFAEKKVVELATATSREKTKLVWGRHSPRAGERVAICEDVTNNFSTAEDAVQLVNQAGAQVVAIITMLNRSHSEIFVTSEGRNVPVVALTFRPMPQYRQDDPAVADDVAKGNVVFKPKAEWPRLKEVMEEYKD